MQQKNALQQGVHGYKSSAKARPVRTDSNEDYVLAEEMKWLVASLCRAKLAIRSRER